MARPRQVSDEEILRVARACLIEHGPSISTAAIARQVGVSQAVLFQRFGTKDEMVRAALASPTDPDWVDVAQRGPDGRPARGQLLELAMAIHGFFDEMVPRWEVLRNSGAEIDFADQEPPPIRFHRVLSGWFSRAVAADLLVDHDAQGAALGLLGALQIRPWFQHVAHHAPGRGARAYVEGVVDLFWSGLRPRKHARPAGPRRRSRKTTTTTRRQTG